MLTRWFPLVAALALTATAWQPGQAQVAPQAREWPAEPVPYLALGSSLLVPGSGHLFSGEWLKGATFFAIAGASLGARIWLDGHLKTNPNEPLRVLEMGLTIGIPTFWIWQAVDSYSQALPPELQPTPSPTPSALTSP